MKNKVTFQQKVMGLGNHDNSSGNSQLLFFLYERFRGMSYGLVFYFLSLFSGKTKYLNKIFVPEGF